MPTPNPVNMFIVNPDDCEYNFPTIVFSKDKTLTVFKAADQVWDIISPVRHSDQIRVAMNLESWRKIHRVFTTNVGPWTKRPQWEDYSVNEYKNNPTDEDLEMFVGENKEDEVTCFPIR